MLAAARRSLRWLPPSPRGRFLFFSFLSPHPLSRCLSFHFSTPSRLFYLFLACLGARKSRTPGGTGAWGAASLSEGKAGKSQGLAGRAGPLWLASYFQSGVHVFESCIFLCNPVSYEAQNRKAGAMFLAWGKRHPRCTGQETNQLPLPFPPSIGTGRETMARND